MLRTIPAVLALLSALSLRLPAAAGSVGAPDPKQAAQQQAVDRVFDVSRLHLIDIAVSAEGVLHLADRSETRYRCTVTFDGLELKDVGVRQAGGVFHPYQSINGKPSLSLKFNEFVKGQRLHGLEKLVLKNQAQDQTLLNEHLTYEVFRRAGVPAPRTAYAVVRLNGRTAGIYLMREPVDDDFMLRNFGSANTGGNLYELEFHAGDFVRNPGWVDLKDEAKEERSRADLLALAGAVAAPPDGGYVGNLATRLDLDRAATYFAVETLTGHWDGVSFRNNNTYLYHLPKEDRFVIIPHGADQSFGGRGGFRGGGGMPPEMLAQRFRTVPELAARYEAALARAGRAPVWDEPALLARVDQIGKLLTSYAHPAEIASDLTRFTVNRPWVEAYIRTGQ
jgi:spore coat protein CotH